MKMNDVNKKKKTNHSGSIQASWPTLSVTYLRSQMAALAAAYPTMPSTICFLAAHKSSDRSASTTAACALAKARCVVYRNWFSSTVRAILSSSMRMASNSSCRSRFLVANFSRRTAIPTNHSFHWRSKDPSSTPSVKKLRGEGGDWVAVRSADGSVAYYIKMFHKKKKFTMTTK